MDARRRRSRVARRDCRRSNPAVLRVSTRRGAACPTGRVMLRSYLIMIGTSHRLPARRMNSHRVSSTGTTGSPADLTRMRLVRRATTSEDHLASSGQGVRHRPRLRPTRSLNETIGDLQKSMKIVFQHRSPRRTRFGPVSTDTITVLRKLSKDRAIQLPARTALTIRQYQAAYDLLVRRSGTLTRPAVNGAIYCIDEPELHLIPKLQATES